MKCAIVQVAGFFLANTKASTGNVCHFTGLLLIYVQLLFISLVQRGNGGKLIVGEPSSLSLSDYCLTNITARPAAPRAPGGTIRNTFTYVYRYGRAYARPSNPVEAQYLLLAWGWYSS